MAANRKLVLGLIIGGFVFLFMLFFIIGLVGMMGSERQTGWAGFGDKIAIVDIKGEIIDSENTISLLREYAENRSVKGILIRINSPGGVVSPAQEIHDEIMKIRNEYGKPVVASMSSMAASGGYYIACACDYIFANPGTLTGSIGVILQYPVVKELIDKIGIDFQTVKAGTAKDIGSPYRKPSSEDSLILQKAIDDVYNQFVDAVAEGRQLSREDVLKVADGSIFTGRQAHSLGLVDFLGGMEQAVTFLADQAEIRGEIKRLRYYEKKDRSILDLLTRAADQYLSAGNISGPQFMYIFR